MLRDVAYDGFLRHDGRLLNGLGLLTGGVDDGSRRSPHQRVADRYKLNMAVYTVNDDLCQCSCIKCNLSCTARSLPTNDDVTAPSPRLLRGSMSVILITAVITLWCSFRHGWIGWRNPETNVLDFSQRRSAAIDVVFEFDAVRLISGVYINVNYVITRNDTLSVRAATKLEMFFR